MRAIFLFGSEMVQQSKSERERKREGGVPPRAFFAKSIHVGVPNNSRHNNTPHTAYTAIAMKAPRAVIFQSVTAPSPSFVS